MRRLALVLAAGAVWLFLFAIPALADNGPHVKGAYNASLSGSCAGCHRAHSGQEPNLLKEPVETLCYSCHSGAGASTDVKDGRTTTNAPLRGGGFEFALIDTQNTLNAGWQSGSADSMVSIGSVAAQATNSHHSIDASAVNMWGSGAIGQSATYTVTTNLECTSCHDPHGNGQYRILKPTPNDTDNNPDTVPPDPGHVPLFVDSVYVNDVPAAGNYNYATLNYGIGTDASHGTGFSESALNTVDNSGANGPTGSVADGSALQYVPKALAGATATRGYYKGTYTEAVTEWCTQCHVRYMGFGGSAGNRDATKAGTADPTFKFLHASRNIVNPANPVAFGGQAVGAANPSTVLTPVNTGEGLYPNAAIGCYTSGSGASATTFNGVAAVLKNTFAAPDPNNCANNASGLLGRTSVPPRPDDTKVTANTLRCTTCHVSHGSNATDGLGQAYTGGVGQLPRGETSLVTGTALHSPLLRLDGRGVCQNCHKK